MTTLKRLCSRLSLVLNWKILTVWAKKYGQVSFSPEPGSGNGFVFIIHLFGPGLKSGMKNMNLVQVKALYQEAFCVPLYENFQGYLPG